MSDIQELRDMARGMSKADQYGVALISKSGLPWCEWQEQYGAALRAVVGADVWAIALNGVVIAESAPPAVSAPDPAPTPELAPLAALSDAELHERTEAAWGMLMVYLAETRRRAGIVTQTDVAPF